MTDRPTNPNDFNSSEIAGATCGLPNSAYTNLTFDDKKNDPTQLSWQLNASVAGGMNQEVNAKIHIGMDGRVRVEPAV